MSVAPGLALPQLMLATKGLPTLTERRATDSPHQTPPKPQLKPSFSLNGKLHLSQATLNPYTDHIATPAFHLCAGCISFRQPLSTGLSYSCQNAAPLMMSRQQCSPVQTSNRGLQSACALHQ